MKVFLDTNVLASALATRGLCAELFEFVLAEHELVASAELLAELERILTAKLRIPAAVTAGFISLIAESSEVVREPGPIPDGIPDPDDAPLIAAALAGGAKCFVTGDKALLDLGAVAAMPILSPRQFWERTRLGQLPITHNS
ncbi:putative toxin-antitoxin system toxin component, PIN family [Sulfurisoma sediminicola]|uniref:Putative PIN family toxin of toxin-antitoxin system n=1 Tax=Sulfurisoma sediminicola TaxID=1381557 RepID=A0A497XAV5_9PROT|nr:putative toxin-antitoxin system toxin component, PIN family [Sulfurisoma sediminicola]RLJ63695.1 putative PIN family toxin of toxin-antitoxin system [Sulfurisoma sediminicola]